MFAFFASSLILLIHFFTIRRLFLSFFESVVCRARLTQGSLIKSDNGIAENDAANKLWTRSLPFGWISFVKKPKVFSVWCSTIDRAFDVLNSI